MLFTRLRPFYGRLLPFISIFMYLCKVNIANNDDMVEVIVRDIDVRKAAEAGMDEFIKVFTDGIRNAIGGTLNADTMPMLNADQITLLAYEVLLSEVMDGGFVQLIHNGYGGFIFCNPFSKMLRLWGMDDLAKIVNKVHKLYNKHHVRIEADCNDDEFMALFEQMPEFDEYDDAFVENEEAFTASVAHYIDEHISDFATIKED